MNAPTIKLLNVTSFRGIRSLTWAPATGVNIILGGGDAGKSTILDSIALLLSPTHLFTVTDTDFHNRSVDDGFTIEAVMDLPPETGIHEQSRPIWPWHWDGRNAVVPPDTPEHGTADNPCYRVRVRGTPDFDLLHEILQPDGAVDPFPVGLRRKIGLVRLGGDDRNDRDLRLVQGSALDRLLADKALRSRLGIKISQTDVKAALSEDAKNSLTVLDSSFKERRLPQSLNVGLVGGPGASITAMIGLTAKTEAAELPLTSWGAGTRRLAALAVAEANQGETPITLVDELERGLEPYRQRVLMKALQEGASQVFVTTHSPAALSAASSAHFWHVDQTGSIGPLEKRKIARQRDIDPEAFLARFAIVAEGKTEVGFLSALLEKAIGGSLSPLGIHICDAGGHESALELLEALSEGGLKFGGFADEEDGKHPERWSRIAARQGSLLFRWKSGCTEENLINALHTSQFEALMEDPEGVKTGARLRTLADRLGIADKAIAAIREKAGAGLQGLMIDAALGRVPAGTPETEKKALKSHEQQWFKSVAGGRELSAKLFSLGLWPSFKDALLPFCNAVRKSVGLSDIGDLSP